MSQAGGKRPGAGRPKGAKNRVTQEVRELALAYGPQALEQVVALMESEDDKTKLAAAREVLDRAYGRPKQSHHLEHDMADSLADKIHAARARHLKAKEEGRC